MSFSFLYLNLKLSKNSVIQYYTSTIATQTWTNLKNNRQSSKFSMGLGDCIGNGMATENISLVQEG